MPAPKLTLKDLLALVGPKPKQRAKNTRLIAIRTRKNLRRFSYIVKGFENYSSGDGHIVSFLYPNLPPFDQLKYHPKLTPLNRQVKVHCTCQAWKYTGPAFMSTREKYRLSRTPETRPAHIRDPEEENYVCKHVVRTIQTLKGRTFAQLLQEFKVTTKASYLASVSPIVRNALVADGWYDSDVDDLLATMSDDNLEEVLEQQGLLVCEEVEDDA